SSNKMSSDSASDTRNPLSAIIAGLQQSSVLGHVASLKPHVLLAPQGPAEQIHLARAVAYDLGAHWHPIRRPTDGQGNYGQARVAPGGVEGWVAGGVGGRSGADRGRRDVRRGHAKLQLLAHGLGENMLVMQAADVLGRRSAESLLNERTDPRRIVLR